MQKLFEESTNDALKGKFHNELACVFMFLGKAENRPDYTDRAIIEHTAASYHFEQAGHISYRARAENNLGFLLYTAGRFEQAHEHLNRARLLFLAVRDKGSVAQVDETRARLLLEEGQIHKASRTIRDAVRTLAKGGEQSILAEALMTQGRILSKLGSFAESRNTLRRAADLAEQAGAVEDAGRALLTLIEEHADSLAEPNLLQVYLRADDLLAKTQDAETIARLRSCARRLISGRFSLLKPQRWRSRVDFWANFNLAEKTQAYEARYIKRALIESQGSITRAARLLGIQHHATLAGMLDMEEGRHKDIAHLRTPPEPLRQSIISSDRSRQSRPRRKVTRLRHIRILHVEDSLHVAEVVRDMLQTIDWKVEMCADGVEAMRKIESKERYDLLIFDNELPGHSGIELTRRARKLPHRRRTPIIMLSGSEVEAEAWGAGANAFLMKPQEIGQLTGMVMRLLVKDATHGK